MLRVKDARKETKGTRWLDNIDSHLEGKNTSLRNKYSKRNVSRIDNIVRC